MTHVWKKQLLRIIVFYTCDYLIWVVIFLEITMLGVFFSQGEGAQLDQA